ncbi:MAG: SGNH/GDSL hydrolase family protein [Rhodobacterales bacterium]|nr:SGNH/GDSL hydrolase family protein [Rhodobacterales bacterium]
MNHIFGAGVVSAILGLTASGVQATTVTSFEAFAVFGDSLSDDGNLYATPAGPLIVSDPPYFEGRRSNGPVWPEYVAARFESKGLPTANYAYGFANAVRNDDIPLGLPYQVPDLPDQVGFFARDAERFADKNTAAVIWAGSNDILTYAGRTDIDALGRASAASVAESARALGGLGVDHVSILNLPDFSQTPRYELALTGLADEVAAGAAAFNSALSGLLPGLQAGGLDVQQIDISAFFADMIATPEKYGVSNSTEPCFFAADILTGPYCTDPDERAFYDDIHPNSVIHAQVGQIVGAQIAPVPVPIPLALLAFGVAALFGIRLSGLRAGKGGAVSKVPHLVC